MLLSGDKPGKGIYVCEKCRIAVDLVDDAEILPYCPCCESHNYLAQRRKKEQKRARILSEMLY